MKTFKQFLELDEGRCWTGYKPVPGKKPYSKGSCKKEDVELAEAKHYPYRFRAKYSDPKTGEVLDYHVDFNHKSLEAAKKHAEVNKMSEKHKLHSVVQIQKEDVELYEESEHKVGDRVVVNNSLLGKKSGVVTKIVKRGDGLGIIVKHDGEKDGKTSYPPHKVMKEDIEFYEEYDAEELFDILEEVIEDIAEANNMDSEIIWEDFEEVSDEELFETAAWRRKEGKDPKGGLNRKGVASYRRENPGSKLKMAVTTPPSKLKKGSKAANRRKSFCARMSGMKGPMRKNGKPTRKALALRKWNCR
jgi:hypothetical protein